MLPLIPIVAVSAAATLATRKLIRNHKKSIKYSKQQEQLPPELCAFLDFLDIHLKNVKDYNPDMTDKDGIPILIRALKNYQLNIAKILLKDGANPNVLDTDKTPAICIAAQILDEIHDNNLIDYFIQNNANLNIMDAHGKNAVFYTTDIKTLEKLFANNIVVNALDNEGRSPLFYAHKIEIADFLCANGNYVNQPDNNGQTPIFNIHDTCLLKYYIQDKKANPFIKDNNARTTLFFVKSLDEALYYISLGVSIHDTDILGQKADILNSLDDKKYPILEEYNILNYIEHILNNDDSSALLTLLNFALLDNVHNNTTRFIKERTLNMISYIKDNKIVNTPDNDLKTPLFYANTGFCVECLNTFKIDFNHRDIYGRTPIFYIHNMQALKRCIAYGSDPLVVDNDGRTPLYFAESLDEILFYVSKGVDINAKDNYGQTIDLTNNSHVLINNSNTPKYPVLDAKDTLFYAKYIIKNQNLEALQTLYQANLLEPIRPKCVYLTKTILKTQNLELVLFFIRNFPNDLLSPNAIDEDTIEIDTDALDTIEVDTDALDIYEEVSLDQIDDFANKFDNAEIRIYVDRLCQTKFN